MSIRLAHGQGTASRILAHLVERVERTPVYQEPFGHFYLEDAFPADIYAELIQSLPPHEMYKHAAERYRGEAGGFVRCLFALTPENLARVDAAQQRLWQALAVALTAPELKRAVYAKLACDLAFRYGMPQQQAG